MSSCDTLIRNARVLDGSGRRRRNCRRGSARQIASRPSAKSLALRAGNDVDAEGLALAPGFIDVHTHDDLSSFAHPEMLPKISQGVTTVIVGNCGISASPVELAWPPSRAHEPAGRSGRFSLSDICRVCRGDPAAQPAVNVAALVGHTALRNNHMDRLDRTATEVRDRGHARATAASRSTDGALGLSTGLAYLSANAASTGRSAGTGATAGRGGRGIRDSHAHRSRGHPRRHERSLSPSAASARVPVDRFPSEVRRHCQLGTQRRSSCKPSKRPAPRNRPAAIAIPTRRARARSTCAR